MNAIASAYVGTTPNLAEATPWFVKKEFKLAPLVVPPELTPLPFSDIKPKEAFQAVTQTRQLQRDLSDALVKVKVLTDQCTAHEQTIAKLTLENNQMKGALQALKLDNLRALAQKDSQIAQMEATVYALDARVRDTEAKLRVESAQALGYHASRLELELQMLTAKAQADDRINHLELTNAKLLGDVAHFVAQRNELQEQAEFHETVIRTLHARMSYFKTRVLELELELTVYECPPEPQVALVRHQQSPRPVKLLLPNAVHKMINRTIGMLLYQQLQATVRRKRKQRKPVLLLTQ